MTAPVRLKLSRAKGYRLQDASMAANGLPAVKVTRPGKWGNPFTVQGCREAGFVGTDAAIASRVARAFDAWLNTPYWRTNWDGRESEVARAAILSGIGELRGKNLACFCDLDAACHADVLLDLANRSICEDVTP